MADTCGPTNYFYIMNIFETKPVVGEEIYAVGPGKFFFIERE